ncbi:glucose-6-phosphate isomerase [Candidatus Saccharibacteria bacterium]|nr:glucose-6-phosphate isomerase [Candidatus Saccharibacteria bacterium]MBP5656485.1 glucose-6-phosphate isomerase [Candidatus Saccharibacteria bacterium]
MINFKYTGGLVNEEEYQKKIDETRTYVAKAEQDAFGGWVNLPIDYDKEEFARIKEAAKKINDNSDYLVCIGIGGSYLGHRAVIEALGGEKSRTKILYAGNSLSTRSLQRIIAEVGDADFSVNVISKSGTTTEPAVAFRVFKKMLVDKYGEEEAAKRIFATTDAAKGALHDEAVAKGYESFVVPDNIGGRYSVLTAVGLLAIAVAGINIDALMDGAAEERAALISDGGLAAEYAAMRNMLLDKDYNIEILANFEPQFMYFNEWWKQLFGESEGKDHKGIYPASVIDSTDLHSMGQYIQQGRRNLFETFVEVRDEYAGITVPEAVDDLDGLKYLEGRELDYINKTANAATREAHTSGGVPVLEIVLPTVDERSLGALIYFFEMSCALSGFTLGVNPFDQPGVEAYKTRMFELLGKPGYEK